MATLQFDPIQLDGMDGKNIQKLNSWIIRLIENLSYILNNLELDNMTSETEKKFSQVQETVKMAKEAKEIADKLKQQLESGGLRGEKERRVIRERRVTKVTKAQMEKRERKAM